LKDIPAKEPAKSRISLEAARAQIQRGLTVKSFAATEIKFGSILQGHYQSHEDDQRLRFLPAAEQTVRDPIELWEHDNRHYYIGLFRNKQGRRLPFVVVTGRKGETMDEVISIIPKEEKHLEKYRVGKLLSRNYETPI
jgi:hypothetical protein